MLVDRDIAIVWTPYYFRHNGNLSHVGTNCFNLVKRYRDGGLGPEHGGGKDWEWKIAVALDTASHPSDEDVSY